jgi:hypothetical protein
LCLIAGDNPLRVKVTRLVAIAIVAFLWVLKAPQSYAETSEQIARKSKEAWSAFQCYAYASKLKNKTEVDRLFNLGYRDIKQFLDGVRTGAVSKDDMSKYAPIGVTMRLAGPSVDFIAGMIFEGAVGDAFKEMYAQGADDALMKSVAANLYQSGNCSLIGR